MNLPNILTVARCALVPLMVVLCWLPEELLWIPGVVFAVAAVTDFWEPKTRSPCIETISPSARARLSSKMWSIPSPVRMSRRF